jgi:methyl-accepting chemotaxis protein
LDLDSAISGHAEWKMKFRAAIAENETLDARSISADNCCLLGKWLHGDAKRLMSGDPGLQECITKHAAFHREAGKVAAVINQKRMAEASAMIGPGTPYTNASSDVGAAIIRLKRKLAA